MGESFRFIVTVAGYKLTKEEYLKNLWTAVHKPNFLEQVKFMPSARVTVCACMLYVSVKITAVCPITVKVALCRSMNF